MRMKKSRFSLLAVLLLAVLATAGLGKTANANLTDASAMPNVCTGVNCRNEMGSAMPSECTGPNCRNEVDSATPGGCTGPGCRNVMYKGTGDDGITASL
jgi:hypothetical protein